MSVLTMLNASVVILSPLKDTITLTIEDKNELLENAAILANHLITRNFIQYIQPNFHATIVKDVSAFLIDTWEGAGAGAVGVGEVGDGEFAALGKARVAVARQIFLPVPYLVARFGLHAKFIG